uniref:Uncharacterized protein n=1 Tax=Arundo donax TaxID=35708 RepID=A0A0A9DRD2_ARUDO
MSCFGWIGEPVNTTMFLHLIIFSQTVEHDTKGSSDATETDTKEASHDPKGEEESVHMEEAEKKRDKRWGKTYPSALGCVSKARLDTREPSRLDKCEYIL